MPAHRTEMIPQKMPWMARIAPDGRLPVMIQMSGYMLTWEKRQDIDHLFIHWEAAYAKSYEIQFSDDEENWTTVYTKGKTTKPGETTGLKITYSVQKVEKGYATVQANWDSVDGAIYKVCVDSEENIAKAAGRI